jgi:hypothetical protein
MAVAANFKPEAIGAEVNGSEQRAIFHIDEPITTFVLS